MSFGSWSSAIGLKIKLRFWWFWCVLFAVLRFDKWKSAYQRSRESGSANLVTLGRHGRQSPASEEGVRPCPSTARPDAPRLWPLRTGQRRDSQIWTRKILNISGNNKKNNNNRNSGMEKHRIQECYTSKCSSWHALWGYRELFSKFDFYYRFFCI